MIRVKKTTFRTSKTDLDRLFACNRESARVWNDCLSYAKDYHIRVMDRISSKTDRQQRDILHKTSRKFTTWADEQQVRTVVVGDVEGVQRNTSKRKKNNPKKKRRTRRQSQRLSQWPFGLLLQMLTYKLNALGIELLKIDEAYTTQTCPVCGRRKKVSGRIYKCHCGYEMHRDIHGAGNILAKHKYGEIRALDFKIKQITYLRPAA